MGFKWAVYLAQTCFEDTFEGGSSDHQLGPERRVMEGAPLPQLSALDPTVHYNYVDDYGFIGLGKDEPEDEHPVRLARKAARDVLVNAGFSVHKESIGTDQQMVGGNFRVNEVIPNQDKLWLAVEAAKEIGRRHKARPPVIETILGILTWCFLLNRGALSIFDKI